MPKKVANISQKSNDFYKRFEIQLKESQNWPGSYIFKFIIKNMNCVAKGWEILIYYVCEIR